MALVRWSSRSVGLFVSILFAALALVTPRPAEAQTIAISSVGISRRQPLRTDPTSRFKVNRGDCVANDVISFPLTIGSYGGTTLEVWATQSTADNCTDDTLRTTATATCWRVYQAPTLSSITLTVPIRVQDIAARPAGSEGQDVGTIASCDGTISTGQPVTLWFMFVQGSAAVGGSASWPTTIDLLGPAPPAVDDIGPPGSELLKLYWTPNTDPDVVWYTMFCEDMGEASGKVTIYEAGVHDPIGDPVQTCVDAGSGTTTDDAGNPIEDAGETNDGSCTPAPATDAGSGGTTGCGSVLVEGKQLTPDEMAQLSCGTKRFSKSSVSGMLSGLHNYNKYAVAVAASDLVENAGPLSKVQCGIPEPVNGFDEVYRNAGGTAGGASFCSVSLRSASARTTLWPGAVFLAGIALVRWRLQVRRPKRAACH